MVTSDALARSPMTIGAPSLETISSLEGLRQHLQWAIELKHSTIPPYLCALYSIEPGSNFEADEVIRSVLLEEMLHMTLAANLLNAVGGRPRLDTPPILPGSLGGRQPPQPRAGRTAQVA